MLCNQRRRKLFLFRSQPDSVLCGWSGGERIVSFHYKKNEREQVFFQIAMFNCVFLSFSSCNEIVGCWKRRDGARWSFFKQFSSRWCFVKRFHQFYFYVEPRCKKSLLWRGVPSCPTFFKRTCDFSLAQQQCNPLIRRFVDRMCKSPRAEWEAFVSRPPMAASINKTKSP